MDKLKTFKEGVMAITPFQASRISYLNTYIMIVGILCGVIVTVFAAARLWWLLIILAAALVNTIIVQIGNYQKYMTLKSIEADIGESSNDIK
jgi:hypothetical protein